MRSHLLKTALALLLAVPIGAAVPIGRDRLAGPLAASEVLSADATQAAASRHVTSSPTDSQSPATPGSSDAADRTVDPSLRGPLTPPPPSELSGYVWPVAHGRITQPFGFSPLGTLIVDGQPFHDGLDIATFCGDRIVAAHDGIVLAAGRRSDPYLGWLGSLDAYRARLDKEGRWGAVAIIVVIADGNGYRSLYAHLSQAIVRPGEHVHAGQLIGYEGATGFAFGCHLHYGLFSAYETATMELDPKIARKTHLPGEEIARIDPLLVLPPR